MKKKLQTWKAVLLFQQNFCYKYDKYAENVYTNLRIKYGFQCTDL